MTLAVKWTITQLYIVSRIKVNKETRKGRVVLRGWKKAEKENDLTMFESIQKGRKDSAKSSLCAKLKTSEMQ